MFDVAEADFELMSWFILMSAFLVGSLIILGSSGVGKYFQTPLALLLYPPHDIAHSYDGSNNRLVAKEQ